MAERYVVIHRTEIDRPIVEADGVGVVSPLDRGFVVDADERQVERLEQEGWRVKAVRDPHTIRLFTYEIDTAGGDPPPKPPGFPSVEADDGVNHLIQLVGPVQESWLAAHAGSACPHLHPDHGHLTLVVDSIGPILDEMLAADR